MNAEKRSAVFVSSKPLCYHSHSSFQSIILLLECVLTNKQYPPTDPRQCLASVGDFFLLIINIKTAFSDSALVPTKHKTLK